MTTITSTTPHHSHHSYRTTEDRTRRIRRSRAGTRAFALGAAIALVCAAMAWAAVAGLHRSDAPTSAAVPAAAAVTHPASAGGSTGPAAAGGAGTTTGSHSAAGTSTGSGSASHGGTSYPQGQDVAALQRDLGQLNYYESPVDGVAGPATRAAIEDFQRANGLPVNGVAGPSTMATIKHQLVTGDNQMGPSGPPAHTAPANGQSTGSTGGAAMATSAGA